MYSGLLVQSQVLVLLEVLWVLVYLYVIEFSVFRNEEIQNQSYRHSSASCLAEVEMGGAHSSENRWALGFQGVGMATPH
ncbi:jg19505, partial [Pararge aegeria aegeria]